MTALVALALATGPDAWIADDGTVSGVVSLAAPPAEVLAVLADAPRVAAIDGGGTRVQVLGADGPCVLLDYTSPSIISDIRYRVRQCPAPNGLDTTLVSSDAFDAWHARWTVTPEGAGSLLRYDIAMDVRLLVPASLVNQTSRRAVRRMLDRMVLHFAR